MVDRTSDERRRAGTGPRPGLEAVRRFGPAVILLAAVLVFIGQNTGSVSFNFLWLDFRAAKWLVLVVFGAAVAVVAWFVGWRQGRRSGA